MKKIIIVAWILSVSFLSSTKAQTPSKHIIYIGYGILTHQSLIDDMVGIATLPILSGDTELSNHSGSFFLGYRRNLSEKLEVGGVFGYEQASSDKLQNAGKSFTAKQHNFALMADVRYNYIAQHRFRLYSGASLGLAIQRNTVDGTEDNTSKSVTQEAFHIDAIGLSYGHRIAPFINLGYGYKGIINLGIQTRF